MDRGDLANLNAFVAIADQGTFRAAASRLGVTPSALSHSMRQLEERLGVRLLHRTTRSVSVTDAGLRLLERLRPAIDQIAGALEDLNQERQRPLGRLRIYAIHLAAAAVIAPIWGRFLSTYPEVHLELAVGDVPIDIVAKGFDAGISRSLVRRLTLRGGGGRARPMISPVTAAFNIAEVVTAPQWHGSSRGIANRRGFPLMGE
jgi:DNA-binding transcriptional LysR family regulator